MDQIWQKIIENESIAGIWAQLEPKYYVARYWLSGPDAWAQIALLVGSWFLARYLSNRFHPRIVDWLSPEKENASLFAKARRFVIRFLPLLLPLFAFCFTALGEQLSRSLFGFGAVIAFGKRVFLLLAVRILVRDIIQDPFMKLLGRFILIPLVALNVVGLLAPVMGWLDATVIPLGRMSFSLLYMVQFAIVGGVAFWLGRWSSEQTTGYIEAQEEMRPATRQLASKAAEIAIFGGIFLFFMNVMGIELGRLAILGGAIGVGLGFGLQKIASNFASGVILLLEGQATVGDYVELDGGEAGTIVRMTARAAILETFDGRWIVVPNEDFITTRVVNFSDQGSANRYEAAFSVSYDTDINRVPEIIEKAASELPFVLQEPEAPDCELRGFGESGVDFALEFWVNGIDDGKQRYTSKVLFAIWNALKAEGIEIPYPHRVVEFKDGRQPPASRTPFPAPAKPKKAKAVKASRKIDAKNTDTEGRNS